MNTTATQVENTLEEQTVQPEEKLAFDAIKELNTIELAYVGGGTACVVFA